MAEAYYEAYYNLRPRHFLERNQEKLCQKFRLYCNL